jgi:hypothetical protein
MLTMKCVLVCAWLASLPLAAAAQPVQRCETARSIDFKNLVYPLEEPRFTNGQTFPLRVAMAGMKNHIDPATKASST